MTSLSHPRVGVRLWALSEYACVSLSISTRFPRRRRPCGKHGVLEEAARLGTSHSLGRAAIECALDRY